MKVYDTLGRVLQSGGGGGGGATFSAGVSTLGNTAGSTGTVSNQVVLVGGSNVTLSQSSGAGGATVSIIGASGGAGAGGGTRNFWAYPGGPGFDGGAIDYNQIHIQPLFFDAYMTVETLAIPGKGGVNANITAQHTYGASVGIYTLENSTKLALSNSAGWSSTVASTGNSTDRVSLFTGPRAYTFGTEHWSAPLSMTPGQYWAGILIYHTAAALNGLSWFPLEVQETFVNSHPVGIFGVGVNTATSLHATKQREPFLGNYSTASIPASIAHTQFVNPANPGLYNAVHSVINMYMSVHSGE
jgi:hypothetical protein